MPVVVGVDAGGSTTVAVAADGERILGTATGGAANLRVAGYENAAHEIAATAARALGDARPKAIFVGAAGAGNEIARDRLREVLERRFTDAAIGVGDDARIALRACVTGDGMMILAGTGSLAYAEIDGQVYRCGGYGYLLGDEGSGFAIGSSAVRLLMRAYDERVPRESWLDGVESQLGVRDVQSVIERVYGAALPASQLAAVAPIVLEAAQAGQRGATKIVQAAALELFDLVKTLARKAQIGDRALPLVFAGGLLAANSLLTYLLETRISNEFPSLEPYKGAPAPEFGALALARALLA
jgi:N-acetylglucosamine kinase-like BadF-type ATPase